MSHWLDSACQHCKIDIEWMIVMSSKIYLYEWQSSLTHILTALLLMFFLSESLLFSSLSSVIDDIFEDYKVIFCKRHCQRFLIHSALIVMWLMCLIFMLYESASAVCKLPTL